MYCQNCGIYVNESSKVCPNCNLPINGAANSAGAEGKKPVTKKWWFWTIIAVVVVAGFISVLTVSNDDVSALEAIHNDLAGNSAGTADTSADTASSLEDGWYGEGQYLAGQDIDAGVYYVQPQPGCYVEVTRDTSGTYEARVSNQQVETSTYISVENGQYLTVRSGKFTKLANAPAVNVLDGEHHTGLFLVGRDIPAGTYTVSVWNADHGYYEINSSCTGLHNDIIKCETFTGAKTVALTQGQYLYVRNVSFAAK